jgi:hypothetical protein
VSLREKILSAPDIESEEVEVPEWDVTVEVRGMTAADRAVVFDAALANGGDIRASNLFADAVLLCAYDPESGERVFTEEDRVALMEKSPVALDRIAKVALRLSGMDAAAADDAGKSDVAEPGQEVPV